MRALAIRVSCSGMLAMILWASWFAGAARHDLSHRLPRYDYERQAQGNLPLVHLAPADKSDKTVKDMFWLPFCEATVLKHLASADKSDKTVKNLIWLLNDTFAVAFTIIC